MSLGSLLIAVRNRLRTAAPSGLGLPDDDCDVMIDGRPPPRCGNRFYAVHGKATRGDATSAGQTNDGAAHSAIIEDYEFSVTLTVRTAFPFDQVGIRELCDATNGFYALADAARTIIFQGRYAILTAANALIGENLTVAGSDRRGFLEIFHFDGTGGNPRFESSQWLWANPPFEPNACIVQELRFPGSKRVQNALDLT